MPSTAEVDFELFERELSDASSRARASRVWRAPSDRPPTTACRWLATGLTLALIGAGAVGLVALDPARAPTVEVPAAAGSMYHVVDQVGARQLWHRGVTGAGVSVAVIDTGVSDVAELSGDKVRGAVDLSGEQSDPATASRDTFGHGTHLSGIIAGRTPGAAASQAERHPEWFMGVAPDAGLVSVKVAGADGVVTREQMIAGVDWVVDHADQLDIRVLTIAFDAGPSPSYVSDPLAAAVERAWNAGIVVVTAAGNEGAAAKGLGSPANTPFVIAVAGVEVGSDGIAVPEWTSRGDGVRDPDVAAPGAHIRSLRAPGSAADVEHPEGYVDEQLFLASGSSQSAAVVAGSAALLLSVRPDLTPDQVKHLLRSTARPLEDGDSRLVGSGMIDVAAAVAAPTPHANQQWQPTNARRVGHVAGSMTIPTTGHPASSSWASSSWASSSWASSSWASSSWASSSWASSSWASSSWASSSWASSSWASSSWASSSWASSSWASSSWASSSWA